MSSSLASEFLLDPAVTYLNHGSFGACPRPVFEVYQRLQRQLERQPVEFLARRFEGSMAQARQALASYLGCEAQDVVYFPNPTTAINMVARSLALGPGDEILASDHEYGAMDRTWRFICRRGGATYVRQPIPLSLTSAQAFVETFWAAVSDRTRVIFLSHITSPTALRFPVEAICRRARQAGIMTIIDGAHAPGQIPLDLSALDADLYTGACHKWLCAPKGSAFLYASREAQAMLQPLVVSWGWEADHPSGSPFIDHHQWQGTRDPAAFLAVPAAIDFQRQHDWDSVRARCHRLASQTRTRIINLTGLEPIYTDPEAFVQMFAARLPPLDPWTLQQRLYDEHHIEVLVKRWNQQPLIRVSFQAYNDEHDADRLLHALHTLLPHQVA